MNSGRRNAAIAALLFIFGAGAVFRTGGSFTLAVTLILFAIWAAVLALPTMDSWWRWKAGFVAALMAGTGLLIWPTISHMSGDKVPCPPFIQNNVKVSVVKGLDLQGGMRLMYTVEVDEAIREKRDNYADQMRRELAVVYGFHSGDGLLKRDTLTKLNEKVHVSTPVDDTAVLRIQFVDPAEATKILAPAWKLEEDVVSSANQRRSYQVRALSPSDLNEQQRIADTFFAEKLLPKAINATEAEIWSKDKKSTEAAPK